MHHPVVACAPNGAYKGYGDHRAIPLKQPEIVRTAAQAVEAGATLLHLHIRDEDLKHSLDPVIYRRTIDSMRDRVGDQLIIQITSEAGGIYTPEQQISCIKQVKPQCVSIALREIIPDADHVSQAQSLFQWLAARACRPQYILYSAEEVNRYLDYLHQGIIADAPHSLLFVLGRYAKTRESSIEDLAPFLSQVDELEAPWMVCAFGRHEQQCVVHGATHGGHIRVGFENNLLHPDGSVAGSNTERLQSTINALADQELQPADIVQVPLDPAH